MAGVSWLTAQVLADCAGGVELRVEGEWLPEAPPPFALTLATAVPKGDRFDWLIEKATELGVERLIPLVTDRSVVDPRGSKLDRLRRSIIEASKQCRRARLMVLDEPIEWTKLVASFPDATRFLADPRGIPPHRWPAIPRGGAVVLAVGPEGGFTSVGTRARPGVRMVGDPIQSEHAPHRNGRAGWLCGLAHPRPGG